MNAISYTMSCDLSSLNMAQTYMCDVFRHFSDRQLFASLQFIRRTQSGAKIMMNFVLILVVLVTVTEQKKPMTFKATTSPNGTNMCRVDPPSTMELMPLGSIVDCGLKCLYDIVCKAFNYYAVNGKCEKYNNFSSHYNIISGCTGFESKLCKFRQGWSISNTNNLDCRPTACLTKFGRRIQLNCYLSWTVYLRICGKSNWR